MFVICKQMVDAFIQIVDVALQTNRGDPPTCSIVFPAVHSTWGRLNDGKFTDAAANVCLFTSVRYDNFAVFDTFWGQGSPQYSL